MNLKKNDKTSFLDVLFARLNCKMKQATFFRKENNSNIYIS